MRYLLTILLSITCSMAVSQEHVVHIKVQKQSHSISLDEENMAATVFINSNSPTLATDKMVIYNANKTEHKTWNRQFTVYDDSDHEIISTSVPVNRYYFEISVKDLLKKLNKDKEYTLYTIALPKDKNKAAVIRVRRIFLCRLLVK